MNKLKELWDKLGSSDNEKLKNQKTTTFFVVVAVIAALLVFAFRAVNQVNKAKTSTDEVKVAKVMGSDFDDVDEESALTDQQEDLDTYKAELSAEKQARKDDNAKNEKQFAMLSKEFSDYKKEQEEKYQDYTERLAKADNNSTDDFADKNTDKSKSTKNIDVSNISEFKEAPITFESEHVTYSQDEKKSFKKTWKNYVPSATYCRAITLSGADAKAGVMSSSNTTPMMFKLEDCWLPDNHHITTLKNSHILASVYGDIGTERGVVRLESISFFDKKSGEAYDIPVDGTVSDISGRNGIKGVPTLRNKAVLLSAGLAGGLSGLGGAVSELGTSQSIGGGGVINTYNPSRLGYSVAGGAVQKSADNISNYLIKLAEAYSPVIEIRPGSVVNVIFQHGFPYRNKDAIKAYSQAMNLARSEEDQSKTSKPEILSNALAQSSEIQQQGQAQTQSPDYNNPVVKGAINSVQQQTALSTDKSQDNPFGS